MNRKVKSIRGKVGVSGLRVQPDINTGEGMWGERERSRERETTKQSSLG